MQFTCNDRGKHRGNDPLNLRRVRTSALVESETIQKGIKKIADDELTTRWTIKYKQIAIIYAKFICFYSMEFLNSSRSHKHNVAFCEYYEARFSERKELENKSEVSLRINLSEREYFTSRLN